ncbi:MAG: spondin domain-containing protein [Lyngbya sp.]|nr:spondin domain-containing protein [Lyngbya sp.]
MKSKATSIYLNSLKTSLLTLAIAVSSTVWASATTAATLKVTIENISPEEGVFFSRTWVGFHDGNFDIFNDGETAPELLERLAEDAITEPTGSFQNTLSSAFLDSGTVGTEGTILGLTGSFSDFFPGDRVSSTFQIDDPTASRYFSYGAMILPSNDAFFGNENPFAVEIFDEEGNFLGADFIITGAQIGDAGTEVNDEVPENTAALAQAAPNTGIDENGVVSPHPGFIPGGNILTAFPNADFTQPNYQLARIKIEKVPEPATGVGLLALGSLFLLKKKRSSLKNRQF